MAATSVTQTSIGSATPAVRSGEVTAENLLQTCLDAIDRRNAEVNAYLSVDREGALARARAIDAGDRGVRQSQLLAGIPFGIKDVLTVEGMPATASSKILEGYHPPYTATAVRKLIEAGAVIV